MTAPDQLCPCGGMPGTPCGNLIISLRVELARRRRAMYRNAVARNGAIPARAGEFLLAVTPSFTLNDPAGQCVIRADIAFDFSADTPGPAGLLVRLYDGPDQTGQLLVSEPVSAGLDRQGRRLMLDRCAFPVSALHEAGPGPTTHKHAVTVEQRGGFAAGTYHVVLEVGSLSAAG